MNIQIKYLRKSPVDALRELIFILPDSDLNVEDEFEQEIKDIYDVALLSKMVAKKYPKFRKKDIQFIIKEEIESDDMNCDLYHAVLGALSIHYPKYYEIANRLERDDCEYAYCKCTFAKAHKFHDVMADKWFSTKVLNLVGVYDFSVGKYAAVYEVSYESSDYMWIIDALRTMKKGEIKYGYGN